VDVHYERREGGEYCDERDDFIRGISSSALLWLRVRALVWRPRQWIESVSLPIEPQHPGSFWLYCSTV
jgi:hypothetical protein